MKRRTFWELYCKRKVSGEAIDDYIHEWHATGPEVTCGLHEYLGMTLEQYGRWVQDDTALEQMRCETDNNTSPTAR